jgi:hypothetical protein
LLDILDSYDEHLTKVFGCASGLSDEYLAMRIQVAASGVVGRVATLVENAASYAARAIFAGTADRFGFSHFAEAFAADSKNAGRPNPFSTMDALVVDTPTVELTPPPELLRRGLSEALFDKR